MAKEKHGGAAKTNVARLLDKAGIAYELIPYEVDENNLAADHVAAELGEDIARVFKTLVLKGEFPGRNAVGSRGRCRRPEKGCESRRRQKGRPYSDEGAAAADGVYPRGMLPDRDEKAFPDVLPLDGAGFRGFM